MNHHPEVALGGRRLGPYQLGILLGEGGFGKVFKAFDDRLGRWVAAKRLRGDATSRAHARFRREARTLAQLGHPAIVQIFDIVEDEERDWIVMELVDGPTLAELTDDGPLDVGLSLEFVRQIASALEAAHTTGIVHRDLKTENVMIQASGHIKVLDFGLARRVTSRTNDSLFAGHTASVTKYAISRTGRVAGTARSMSPEQANGKELDSRSDLFSLGVLLYEILTGRSPFLARSLNETLRRVITHCPPPIVQLHPRVPLGLSRLAERLLEKDPLFRPQTAAEVVAKLALIAASNPAYLTTSVDLSRISEMEFADVETIEGGKNTADRRGEEASDTAIVATILACRLAEPSAPGAKNPTYQGESRRRLDRISSELLEEYDGREVTTNKNSFLLLFNRPWNAIDYALAYQEVLRDLSLAASIGIHLGEIFVHHNSLDDIERGALPIELEGSAKSTAMRLLMLAVAGQTLLSRTAYGGARRGKRLEHESALEWKAHGRYRFFETGDEIEIFQVAVPGSAPLRVPISPKVASLVAEIAATDTVGRLAFLGPARLRQWPPLELPEVPYPVLLPHNHPDLITGREQELARLRRLLDLPIPILGLSSPSGIGKSSLLVGALMPALRAEHIPVALVEHPTEVGVASRLIGDLLEGIEPIRDDNVDDFVDSLLDVERLAGAVPVFVLDQFEDVLRSGGTAARATLGSLMAASVLRHSNSGGPMCRWVIAYRQEYSGRLALWLSDVLIDGRASGMSGLGALPHDLSRPERFQSMSLSPLATPSPGAEDPMREATRIFLTAIERPLYIHSLSCCKDSKSRRSRWSFTDGGAERLARAFAKSRIERADAPLVPELQVVLAYLLSGAGSDGIIHVPIDANALIGRALEDHLTRAIESAFPETNAKSVTRRARALLALRELASASYRRDVGLRSEEVVLAIGNDGERILDQLATPFTRLVTVREVTDGLRWSLAHNRMAEAIVRLVEEEGRRGSLVFNSELLALRRFVMLRTALFKSGERRTSIRVARGQFRQITTHAGALLCDVERKAWFAACRQQRRVNRGRFLGVAGVMVLILTLVAKTTWEWARLTSETRTLRAQLSQGSPEAALQSIDALFERQDNDRGELLELLKQRETPMDLLGRGLGGVESARRNGAVIQTVELVLPWVKEAPLDSVLIANLLWALDYAPGRDPLLADRARILREQVLAPLRRLRPPPPRPMPEDPDWVHVPAGTFFMGTGDQEAGKAHERPRHNVTLSAFRIQRHEVTNEEYRQLVPEHQGRADLPASRISWFQAYTYAGWLGGRLPTEAEWEYAARAGCAHVFCSRQGKETTIDAVAWTVRNSLDQFKGELSPQSVMRLEPNPWGIYDMLGNLWEWTADWYGEYQHGHQVDPWGPPSGGGRVDRGGGFRIEVDGARAAFRDWIAPSKEFEFLGLRVALPVALEP